MRKYRNYRQLSKKFTINIYTLKMCAGEMLENFRYVKAYRNDLVEKWFSWEVEKFLMQEKGYYVHRGYWSLMGGRTIYQQLQNGGKKQWEKRCSVRFCDGKVGQFIFVCVYFLSSWQWWGGKECSVWGEWRKNNELYKGWNWA